MQLDFKIVRGNASAVEAMMSADNFSQTYTTFDTVGDVARDVSERLHLLPQDVTLYREHDDIAKASGEAAEQPAETVAHKWRRFAIKAGVDEEKLPFRDVPLGSRTQAFPSAVLALFTKAGRSSLHRALADVG